MFYRRKVLLALLQIFDGELTKTEFQKYLFLFTRMQETPSYDFIPYHYGCFSFQSMADKTTLEKYGLISAVDRWKLTDDRNFIKQLTEKDRIKLRAFKVNFSSLNGRELIRYVYLKYPYYAINSKIVHEILNSDELEQVNSHKTKKKKSTLFTIGYEGKTFEQYLNQLIKQNVRLLCDVRKNPISRKYGFSKNQLKSALEKLNINYIHIPELGIESFRRQNLNSEISYKALFKTYEEVDLPQRKIYLEQIKALMNEYQRIALTCFENSHTYCHRGCITKTLSESPGWNFKIEHI